jgi:DNA-binding MarR family transcriptional regulator
VAATPRDGDPVLRFLHLLAAGGRNAAGSRRLRELTGLPLTVGDVHALERMPAQAVPIGDVARALGCTLSRASRKITRLELLGLVTRVPDRLDGRSSRVCPAPAAAAPLTAWRRYWVAAYAAALADWSAPELTRFGDLLDRLMSALDEPSPGPLPPDTGTPAGLGAAGRHALSGVVRFVRWAGGGPGVPPRVREALVAARSPVTEQAVVLLRATARHGPLGITELAARIALHPSQTSRGTIELERRGFVDRADDTLDGRSRRLKATPRGTALLRRIDECELAPIGAATARWTETDREDLRAGFHHMCAGFVPETPPTTRGGPVDIDARWVARS